MKSAFGGMVLDIAFRVTIPFIFLYAMYVLVNGELSPGGGFQGGALIAIGIVLARLVHPEFFPSITLVKAGILSGIGTSIYALTGFLPLFFGGSFLEYSKLPFKAEVVSELHATGIFMIEIGVTVCVMATVLDILQALLEKEEHEDD